MAQSPPGPVSEWGATSRAPHSTSAPYRNVTCQLSSRSLGTHYPAKSLFENTMYTMYNVFSKSYLAGVGYIFWPKKFLQKPNFPKYAYVLVVTFRKLKSEKCPITPAKPPPPYHRG